MAAQKRIIKDLAILEKNKDDLQSRGIYFRPNEDNFYELDVLIVPREKSDGELKSPYSYGFFMFHFTMSTDYPMLPPDIQFYPMQSKYRLHPNYYENGKVCLSVINTWGGNDWSPATSLHALINILEERFSEDAILFEPSMEKSCFNIKKKYCEYVEYAKYNLLLEIKKTKLYLLFKKEIHDEWYKNKSWLLSRLEELIEKYGNIYFIPSQCYFCKELNADYGAIKERLSAFSI